MIHRTPTYTPWVELCLNKEEARLLGRIYNSQPLRHSAWVDFSHAEVVAIHATLLAYEYRLEDEPKARELCRSICVTLSTLLDTQEPPR